jgi:Protein of unknown function (DUF1501)
VADSVDPIQAHKQLLTRRGLLRGAGAGIGFAALGDLLGGEALAGSGGELGGVLGGPHFAPKAKRVICLFMSGGPSQLDTWDYKPQLREHFDEDLPDSVRQGQRFTTMTSGQSRFPVAPSKFKFSQHGQAGTWVSELLPHTAGVVDQLSVIRSLYTEAINHDPAMTFFQSGAEQPGRPSLGAWLSYGLGSMNSDLPTYVVMTPTWTGRKEAQALFSRLWGTGFLPSRHQGISLRAKGDPILYLNDPPGVSRGARREMLDTIAAVTEDEYARVGDPNLRARLDQYEMAFRMQASVPELVDLSGEPRHVLDLYGPDVEKPGTFAASTLLARRLVERGTRFVQLYHRGWDQHANVGGDLPNQCRDVDQACAGLILDLEQRGLLEDTLVLWGGEFGRTVYSQGALSKQNYGRDHHPRCFTWWMAGAGVRRGYVHGETDDYSYNIVKDGVHVHDLNATVMHLLGIDHERLTFRFQGRDFRLTDVHGEVVREVLA